MKKAFRFTPISVVTSIIYLKTSPETAYERKKARARKEEEVSLYFPK